MTEPPGDGSPRATVPNTIQTSAAINPGNSGGALVDLAGDVVGIPTLAATDQQEGGAAPGGGFAIPSNVVTNIAKQIISLGAVRNSHRAALGVEVSTVYDQQTGAPGGVGVVSGLKGIEVNWPGQIVDAWRVGSPPTGQWSSPKYSYRGDDDG